MGKKSGGIATHVAAFAVGVALATAVGAVAGPHQRSERRFEKLDVFAQALSFIENNYVDEIGERELIYGAVHGMVDRLDPHSKFLTPERYRRTREDTEGVYAGIGITLDSSGPIPTVAEVLPRSPAQRAGLVAGDRILGVDGTPIQQWNGTLRGPAGTRVALDVGRDGWPASQRFTLVRERVRVAATVSADLGDGVAYLRIRQFQHATAAEVRRALSEARKRGRVRGVVLDLRGNPGGLFDEAIRVADLFIDEGVIVRVEGRRGRITEEHRAHRAGSLTNVPVAALIDGDSASSAEIVAGALQDHRRATVFGETSYGKGSVQSFLDLEDGSGLKLTTSRYLTPNGRSIHGIGIEPDVRIAGLGRPLPPKRDPLVAKACRALVELRSAAVP